MLFLQNYNLIQLKTRIAMQQIEIKNAFVELGKFLSQFSNQTKNTTVANNALFFDDFNTLIDLSQSHNGWYTNDNVRFAVKSWANALTLKNLDSWLAPYGFDDAKSDKYTPKTIAIILAGNIPLVGFHDFLSVLISGHNVLVKCSSNDQKLLPFLAKYLISVAPQLSNKILFIDGKLDGFDAVIATGSNNTARYFEYYFRDKPSIIRKARNSVAILNGLESKQQMIDLGEDIFRYFGLGCRSVSKIFVPKNYNFDLFFNGIFEQHRVINYEKYANNYDYNKAVFLMSNFNLLDNEFLIIKEDTSYASPIATVFYEFYDDLEQLKNRLKADQEKIQCIVSNQLVENSIAFGQTQNPKLSDYADGVDSIKFLIEL